MLLAYAGGATATKYAMIASGIAGALIAGFTVIGGSVTELWTTVANVFR